MKSTIFQNPVLNHAYLYVLQELAPNVHYPAASAVLDFVTDAFEVAELERLLTL